MAYAAKHQRNAVLRWLMLALVPLAYGGVFLCSMVMLSLIGMPARGLCDGFGAKPSTSDLLASGAVCLVLFGLAGLALFRVRQAWRATGVLHIDRLVFAAGCLAWVLFAVLVGIPLRGDMLQR